MVEAGTLFSKELRKSRWEMLDAGSDSRVLLGILSRPKTDRLNAGRTIITSIFSQVHHIMILLCLRTMKDSFQSKGQKDPSDDHLTVSPLLPPPPSPTTLASLLLQSDLEALAQAVLFTWSTRGLSGQLPPHSRLLISVSVFCTRTQRSRSPNPYSTLPSLIQSSYFLTYYLLIYYVYGLGLEWKFQNVEPPSAWVMRWD